MKDNTKDFGQNVRLHQFAYVLFVEMQEIILSAIAGDLLFFYYFKKATSLYYSI